jgi:cell wall-associated NlpC family hydrolase
MPAPIFTGNHTWPPEFFHGIVFKLRLVNNDVVSSECHKLSNLLFSFLLYTSCTSVGTNERKQTDSVVTNKHLIKANPQPSFTRIETRKVSPGELVSFAETLVGTPYKYASTDPRVGFDCSGFITYVFNHFNIRVPRSSIDFTNVGKKILLTGAKPGDLILFTGTDSTIHIVGHIGIIVSNEDGLVKFIHSTSGRAYGVVITPLEEYYTGRFVKVIRVFDQG